MNQIKSRVFQLSQEFKSLPPLTKLFYFFALVFVVVAPIFVKQNSDHQNFAGKPSYRPKPSSISTVSSIPTLSATQMPGSNDTMSPKVSITSPINGSTVDRGHQKVISASASDNVGVSKVEFRVSNTLKCTASASPYNCNWLVPAKPGATYAISVTAYDVAGNSASSTVTVILSH